MKSRSKVKRSSLTWIYHPQTWLGGAYWPALKMDVPNMLEFHNFFSVTQYKHFLLNYWS